MSKRRGPCWRKAISLGQGGELLVLFVGARQGQGPLPDDAARED